MLIGGSTAYDANQAALIALSNEWASANPVATRITNLKNGTGLNSPFALNAASILDDGTADVLASGSGGVGNSDWFLGNTAQDSLIGVGTSQVN